MFNLGYKEVVLNSLGDITGDAMGIVIPGYGTFNASQIANPVQTPAQDAIAEKSSYTVVVPPYAPDAWGNIHTIAPGDVFEVKATFRSMRNVGSQARDFIMDGKTIIWQSVPIGLNTPAGISAAVVEGYNLAIGNGGFGHNFEQAFKLEDGAATLDFEFLPGFEYLAMKKVELKLSMSGGTTFISLDRAGFLEGSAGIGLGKWVEESRRMATEYNVMPYAVQHGGNSQGVDVRGKYKTYMFDFQGEDNNGWKSHDFVDHSFVNAEMESKPVHYVIYANEADADLLAILDSFIA